METINPDYAQKEHWGDIIKVYVRWHIGHREVSIYDTECSRTVFITRRTFDEIIDSRKWGIDEVQWKIENILDSNILNVKKKD